MKKLWETVCQKDSSTIDGVLGAIDHFISCNFSPSVSKLSSECVLSSPLDGSSGVRLLLYVISFLFSQ